MQPSEAWLDPSFDAFITRSSPRLLRTAFLLSGDAAQADDLLQLTLVRTGRRWASAQAAPEAYAHRVLVNLLHDWRRGLARRVAEAPLDDQEHRPGLDRDHADTLAERDEIIRAMRSLSVRQREVLVLRFFADLSVEDTAAAIGTSAGAVKTHTSRALDRLRELLSEPAPPAETQRGAKC